MKKLFLILPSILVCAIVMAQNTLVATIEYDEV